MLTVEQTFQFETAKFIFKEKNNLLPISTIAHHFDRSPSSNRPIRQTQTSHPNVVPYDLLTIHAKKSIQLRANKVWNDIPRSITSSPYFSSFKRLYKEFLLQNEPPI